MNSRAQDCTAGKTKKINKIKTAREPSDANDACWDPEKTITNKFTG